MKIKIDDVFHVVIDDRNFTLYEHITENEKTGEAIDSMRIAGYFVNMEHVLHEVVQHRLAHKKDSEDLKGFLREYLNTAEYVRDIFRTSVVEHTEKDNIKPRGSVSTP